LPDAYDEVRYPSLPRDQSHPAYIAALARIAGIELPAVERWRVLEIGCGNGSNILPLAFDYPEAHFLGIDRARESLEEGQALASDLGLANLELLSADLLDWQPAYEFDYIIAHGVYSWVPEEVREKILRICDAWLKPTGIAYVSYNALPGCYLRRFARDLLRFHVHREADPGLRIEKARDFAKIVATMAGEEPLQTAIRNEMETLIKRDAAALYHDDLAEINDPLYLLDFVAQAARHGLQYLGDADPRRDDLQDQPAFAEDWLESRQYSDFLMRRRFRETLLCRKHVTVDRKLMLERFRVLFAASRVKPADIQEDGVQRFDFPGSGSLATNHPLTKKLLFDLSSLWPRWTRLSEFELDSYPANAVADLLMRLARSQALELRISPSILTSSITERPVVSALARAQIARGYSMVTNQRHQEVEMNNVLSRKLLSLLDGSRDRAALIRDLAALGADPESTARTLEVGLLELYRLCLLTG
jgi:SAM-dependent methyltransferase